MKYRIVQIGERFFEVQNWRWWFPFWTLDGYYHDVDEALERVTFLRDPYKPKVLDL